MAAAANFNGSRSQLVLSVCKLPHAHSKSFPPLLHTAMDPFLIPGAGKFQPRSRFKLINRKMIVAISLRDPYQSWLVQYQVMKKKEKKAMD